GAVSTEMRQDQLVIILIFRGVGIPTEQTGFGKAILHQFFQLFGTQSELPDLAAATIRALGWHFSGIAAQMAEQTLLAAVPCQGLVVIGTAQTFTAMPAKNIGCLPTAIEKEDCLLVFIQHFLEATFQST